jgi:hypothetical protein
LIDGCADRMWGEMLWNSGREWWCPILRAMHLIDSFFPNFRRYSVDQDNDGSFQMLDKRQAFLRDESETVSLSRKRDNRFPPRSPEWRLIRASHFHQSFQCFLSRRDPLTDVKNHQRSKSVHVEGRSSESAFRIWWMIECSFSSNLIWTRASTVRVSLSISQWECLSTVVIPELSSRVNDFSWSSPIPPIEVSFSDKMLAQYLGTLNDLFSTHPSSSRSFGWVACCIPEDSSDGVNECFWLYSLSKPVANEASPIKREWWDILMLTANGTFSERGFCWKGGDMNQGISSLTPSLFS